MVSVLFVTRESLIEVFSVSFILETPPAVGKRHQQKEADEQETQTRGLMVAQM
jgi:hypothetical protein